MAYFDAVSSSAPLLWWQMISTYLTASTFHRYWRMYMLGTSGGNSYTAAEIRFASATVGPNMLAATSTIASSSMFSGLPGTNAVDQNIGTFWASANTTPPQWFSWDAGVGNAVEVRQVELVGRGDSLSYVNQGINSFNVQWSDDNIDWNTWWTATSSLAWTILYQTQTFTPTSYVTLSFVPNDGTGSVGLSGAFTPSASLALNFITGSATSSNPAYNAAIPQSAAFYSAVPAAGNALITGRVHDLDFIWPLDPANYGKGYTLEWWMKYPRFVANSATAIFGFGGYDGFAEGISVFAAPVVGNDAARCLGLAWSHFSGASYSYAYGFPGSTWIQYGMNDQEWYHCALTIVNHSATTGAPAIPGGAGSTDALSSSLGDGNIQLWVNGRGIWPQTSVGTWVTISGNAGNNYFNRSYSGGMRFWVGNSSNLTWGAQAGQNVYVQQVAVYDHILGAEEIMGHWMSTRMMLPATGTLYSPAPIYSVQLPMRDVVTQASGTAGTKDPRATKTNPGSN